MTLRLNVPQHACILQKGIAQIQIADIATSTFLLLPLFAVHSVSMDIVKREQTVQNDMSTSALTSATPEYVIQKDVN